MPWCDEVEREREGERIGEEDEDEEEGTGARAWSGGFRTAPLLVKIGKEEEVAVD